MSSNIPSASSCSVYEFSSFTMPVVVQIIMTFYHATGPWWQDFYHRVTQLIVCPTHLINSMADTLIQLDSTRKCLSNVLRIVPVKMIDFFQICQSWIDKVRWDGRCHAWGRSRLLYLVITSISCDVPSTACVINWQSIFVNNLDLSNFLLESGLPYFVFHLSVSCWSILWVLQDVTVLIHEHYEPAFWIVFTCYGKRMTVKKLSLILIFYQNFANIPWKN